MALYRYKARSTTPGQYRLAATVLQNLVALADILLGTGRGDGGIGTLSVSGSISIGSTNRVSTFEPLRIIGEYLRTNISIPASTTLDGALTASALSIPIISGAVFADYNSPLALKCGSELMLGVRSSNTITIDLGGRGAFGTTAASHITGSTLSLANLYALCGARIYPDRLPDGFNNTLPTIVFNVRGGAGLDVNLPTWAGSVQFFCYGGSRNFDDTTTLARALADRFHNTIMRTVSSGVILSSHEEVVQQDATEPDTEYPRVFTAYSVNLRSL